MAKPADAAPTLEMICQICKTVSTVLIERSTPARCARCGRVIEPRLQKPIVSDPAEVIDVETIVPHRGARR